MQGIIVGVDESANAVEALRWAVAEGAWRERPVTAVLAWGYLDQHHATPDQPFDPEYHEDDAQAALAALVVGVARPGRHRRTADDLRPPRPRPHRGRGGRRARRRRRPRPRRLPRAPARFRESPGPAPCAVPRRRRPRTPRAAAAADRGRRRRFRCVACLRSPGRSTRVGVATRPSSPSTPGRRPSADSPTSPRSSTSRRWRPRARQLVERELEAVDTSGLPAPVERHIVVDGPAAAVLGAAKEATLVVVGKRGQGGFKELLLGSVSDQVTQHASCPVIVVPHRGE